MPGTTFENVRVLDSAGSESSSSEKLEGDRPPVVVKAKSCGSLGSESSVSTTLPRLVLAKVQVTVSPAAIETVAGELPLSQLAELAIQPLGSVCRPLRKIA